MRWAKLVLFVVLVLLGLNNVAEAQRISQIPSAIPLPPKEIAQKEIDHYSNIRQEDYIGPEACGECHRENYESWKQHPHSRMNTLATDETVVGDFSGVSLSYADGRVVFLKRDGAL